MQFDPPLSTTVTVVVPPLLTPRSFLRFYVTLSRSEHASLRREGTKVQVWSDWATGEWSELSFEEQEQEDSPEAAADFSLLSGDEAGSQGDMLTLVAATPLPPLLGRIVQFTYRIVHASGSVSWLGSVGTNGSIGIKQIYSHDVGSLQPESWGESAPGVFSWSSATGSPPVVVAKLDEDADWRGWAIGEEGPSSFTAISSTVTERVALALLPKARRGAYVTYSPVLYHTTGNATLSLNESGEVLFHPREGTSTLHISTDTEMWMNAISDKTTTLDVCSRNFLGVSVQQSATVRRIHILPIFGRRASVTLTSAAFKSLASASDTLVFVDCASHAARFFAVSSLDSVRIAVGPTGGKIFVVSAYMLRNKEHEWRVACLPRGAGRVTSAPKHTTHAEEISSSSSTENATSESVSTEELFGSKDAVAPAPERHPFIAPQAILLLSYYMLRLFWGLFSALMSPSSSSQTPRVPTAERTSLPVEPKVSEAVENKVLGSQPLPEVTFEVTGNFMVVVKGEISKLAFSFDGTLFKPSTTEVGEELWLFEGDARDKQQLLQVASQG